MRHDKTYMALLGAYREVYEKLSVDFDSIDKVDNWFYEYELPESEQLSILDNNAKKFKLNKYQKTMLTNAYLLGCSPKFTKINNE